MWKWFRGSGGAVLVALACYSLQDVRNEGCKAFCVSQGHDSGRAVGKKLNKCECIDIRDYGEVANEPISLGVAGAPVGEAPAPPSSGYQYHPYSPYHSED